MHTRLICIMSVIHRIHMIVRFVRLMSRPSIMIRIRIHIIRVLNRIHVIRIAIHLVITIMSVARLFLLIVNINSVRRIPLSVIIPLPCRGTVVVIGVRNAMLSRINNRMCNIVNVLIVFIMARTCLSLL